MPISKLSKLDILTFLKEKVKKKFPESTSSKDLIMKLQQIQQSLKVAIVLMKPDIDFEEEPSPLFSFSLNKDEILKVDTKISEILIKESRVDESILECMQKITRISHCLKTKALREGVYI